MAVDLNSTFVLTGPDGQRAVFGSDVSPTSPAPDADFIGLLSDTSGLDSAEVRENAENLVERDGGIHGGFYYGRRPISLEGQIWAEGTWASMQTRIRKLQRATDAMVADATLVWTPSDDAIARRLLLRRQQPLRITGARDKRFQAGLVSARAVIESNLEIVSASTAGGTWIAATNSGTIGSWPTMVITAGGATTSPIYLEHRPTGGAVDYTVRIDRALVNGEVLTVNFENRTIVSSVGGNVYSNFNFLNSTWWRLPPGASDVRARANSGVISYVLRHRHTWV